MGIYGHSLATLGHFCHFRKLWSIFWQLSNFWPFLDTFRNFRQLVKILHTYINLSHFGKFVTISGGTWPFDLMSMPQWWKWDFLCLAEKKNDACDCFFIEMQPAKFHFIAFHFPLFVICSLRRGHGFEPRHFLRQVLEWRVGVVLSGHVLAALQEGGLARLGAFELSGNAITRRATCLTWPQSTTSRDRLYSLELFQTKEVVTKHSPWAGSSFCLKTSGHKI